MAVAQLLALRADKVPEKAGQQVKVKLTQLQLGLYEPVLKPGSAEAGTPVPVPHAVPQAPSP